MIVIPRALAESLRKHFPPEWLAGLAGLAERTLDQWRLTVDGKPMHGMASLVLPVVRPDGTRAALKLQPVDWEHESEPVGLRTWDGDGIVRLLDHDRDTGAMLLERLDDSRPLSTMPDDFAATEILAGLLARLTRVPGPDGMRHLKDSAEQMVANTPGTASKLSDQDEQNLLKDWAARVSEVLDEPGDRLLHWDLHYDNVLAADREPWLAIDPKPLVGDPGFDIMPALDNRWDDIVATGDVPKAVLRRFDLLTEALGADRQRAAGWTVARALQNSLWEVDGGEQRLDPIQVAIAQAVTSPRR
ncbi:streptomycin 6-kinase [Kibdelosporangium phytohabitans]|uniref:Hydroxyurea phosphotransferase n=1 Tax=Kibdelosporangium phytohabitans TaxID=860235 RepID=A0A0N7F390_9PSEU|nr:aminoglycoside phosphotransferase family protein [Kibdelosporangium phytohabitans]ALG07967.1 hydroxyurea phosphotransferase [Kibdelosporangium phytohabitans]MBE1471085.1 streptomycin 6-kinase [Kibdelosporangium phytohabitans]